MGSEFQIFLQLCINGLAIGCIYALTSLGFVIIYKSTKVINFAQGELMMLGAYFCFMLTVSVGLGYYWSFLLSLIFSALLGLLIQYIVLKKMIGEPIFSVVMITIGLASILKSAVGLIWQHDIKRINFPMTSQPLRIGGVVVSYIQIGTVIISVACIALFLLFFKYTSTGLSMRGTAEDQDTSLLMGIDVFIVFAFSWVISAMVATVGGIFLGSYIFMTPEMSSAGLKAFPAVILGGLESIGGSVIGGVSIGIIENLVGGYVDSVLGVPMKEIAGYVVLIIVLMIRPYGLFGQKEIERV